MGSTPSAGTTFTEQIVESTESRTGSAQKSAEPDTRKMKFPQVIKHRKAEAQRIVRELANGSQTTALSANQSRDALAAIQRLEGFCQSTGRHVSPAKSRNHYRATVQQFLQWCSRKDHLPVAHRLKEADSMRPEHANTAEVLFYTPKEFREVLESAEGVVCSRVLLRYECVTPGPVRARVSGRCGQRTMANTETAANHPPTPQPRRLAEVRSTLFCSALK